MSLLKTMYYITYTYILHYYNCLPSRTQTLISVNSAMVAATAIAIGITVGITVSDEKISLYRREKISKTLMKITEKT